jgi:hypothetical protein
MAHVLATWASPPPNFFRIYLADHSKLSFCAKKSRKSRKRKNDESRTESTHDLTKQYFVTKSHFLIPSRENSHAENRPQRAIWEDLTD